MKTTTPKQIRSALSKLRLLLEPADAAYFSRLKSRATRAIRAGKPMRLDALRIEVKARTDSATTRTVFEIALDLLGYLMEIATNA